MKTLSQKVFESLKVNILNFSYLPGVKLSDDEIAAELRVSRTPVREALNRLSELGLVEAKSNKGFRVKRFLAREIEDLYVLRATLECLAVRLTIKRMNPEAEKQLRNTLSDYPQIIKSGDLWRFNLVDTKFHDMIARLSGNSALRETLSNLYDKIQIIRRYDHLRAGSLENTYQEHLQILEYILRRDVKKSEQSMSKHILASLKIILKIKE